MITFNWADYAIIGIIAFSLLVSIFRGLIREVLSLVIWGTAIWVAYHFGKPVAEMLVNYIKTPSIRLITACATLFLLTLIVGGIINYILGQLIEKTGLSGTDRVLGSVFGLARGVLIVALLLLLASLTPMKADPWWKTSFLIPQFKPIEIWLQDWLKDVLPTGTMDNKQKPNPIN